MCFSYLTARANGPARYIYIPVPQRSWYDAQTYCRQNYTDLAIIKDDGDAVDAGRILMNNKAWIGLFRDSWKWVDESNMSSILWGPGQPYNMDGYSNCGLVSQGQVSNERCFYPKPFFCYSGRLKLFFGLLHKSV